MKGDSPSSDFCLATDKIMPENPYIHPMWTGSKKEYKEYYMPPKKPVIVTVPPMNYIAVRGHGDPNAEDGDTASDKIIIQQRESGHYSGSPV